MLRRVSLALLLPLMAACLLVACDGEQVDYNNSARYDISWIWQGGLATTDARGDYGALGVAASTNQPGARQGAASWRDVTGKFWLFGGYGHDADDTLGSLNDLWQYDGTNWIWMGGSSIANAAGTYGTKGIADAANMPGGRAHAVSWVDATGKVWLFGGLGRDGVDASGRLNDLWTFDGTQWTWVGGAGSVDAAGVYGTQGVADSANGPGARYDAAGWADADNNLWLFAGNGMDGSTGCCWLNDLWVYSTATGKWSWVHGANTANAVAVYGTQAAAEVANTPGGRYGMTAWLDSNGSAWVYGGTGNNANGDRIVFDELWNLVKPADGSARRWAWVSGAQAQYVAPAYVARGTVNLVGSPGSRYRPTSWVTGDTLWLFGGDVEAVNGTVTHPNDLWRYDSGYWTWVGGQNIDNPAGSYAGIGEPGQPGGRSGAASWIDIPSRTLWLFGGDDRADLWFYVYSP